MTPSQAPTTPERPTPRALVVDDEEAMLEVFSDLLARVGIEVTTENDPRSAVARLRNGAPFDLIVLDLRMPHLDGHALLAIARDQRPETPIVVVTGYPSQASLDRCRELGVTHYFRKPFDPDHLARELRRLLAARLLPAPPEAQAGPSGAGAPGAQ